MGIGRIRVAPRDFIPFSREVVLCWGRHYWLLHLQGFCFAVCSSVCVWQGAAGVPRAALHCTPRHWCSILVCQGAGLCSASAQGLAADTSRGPSKLSHVLPSSLHLDQGLHTDLHPSLPIPKCTGWQAHQTGFAQRMPCWGCWGGEYTRAM